MTEPDDAAEEPPGPSRLGDWMEQPAPIIRQLSSALWFAALLALPMLWCLVSEVYFLARSAGPVPGEIVDFTYHRYGTRGGSTSVPAPVYHFRTADGHEMRVAHPDNSMLADAGQRGEQVQLLYDPADPKAVQKDGVVAQWGSVWLYSLAPLLVLFLAAIHRRRAIRTARLAFRLRDRGIVVEAEILRIWKVVVPAPPSVGRAWGWLIEVSGRLPDSPHDVLCRSDVLPEDPRPFIAGRLTLPVLVDPAAPERALLIAEFLPLAPDFGLRRRAGAAWEARQATATGQA